MHLHPLLPKQHAGEVNLHVLPFVQLNANHRRPYGPNELGVSLDDHRLQMLRGLAPLKRIHALKRHLSPFYKDLREANDGWRWKRRFFFTPFLQLHDNQRKGSKRLIAAFTANQTELTLPSALVDARSGKSFSRSARSSKHTSKLS